MEGKVCMITGATSGIGKATALGLARMGVTVVIVGRDKGRGEEALTEIRAATVRGEAHLLLADLSSQGEIRRLVQDFAALRLRCTSLSTTPA